MKNFYFLLFLIKKLFFLYYMIINKDKYKFVVLEIGRGIYFDTYFNTVIS